MLHYSNASSIEKNRRYLVIKGGACLIALLFIVFPLCCSFPVDSETDADAPVVDYVIDDPSLSEQPGKPPPLITRYHLLFSILLALE